MRKMLTMFILGALILLTTVAVSFAVNPDFGYVIVRCTVTISVDVEEPDNIAYFGTGDVPQRYDVPAGGDYVSISSITVTNDSNGAICKWSLRVSTIQYKVNWNDPDWLGDPRWTLNEENEEAGVHKAVLYAVFATSRPASGEFNSEDRLLISAGKIWKHKEGTTDAEFDPTTTGTGLQYTQPDIPGYNPGAYKAIRPDVDNRKALWFRLKTPTAVVDEWYRRFVIEVTAALHSSSE